jgi:hypothetical protein
MTDVDQQLKEAAHLALINVTPRGDDQVHLIDFLRATSESAESADDLLLRLGEVCSPEVIAKKSVTNNPNLFLAIRQLLTAYRVPVRRGTGFPVIQGVLEALFGTTPDALQEALRVWKSSAAPSRSNTQVNQVDTPVPEPAIALPSRSLSSRVAQDISRRFPYSQRFSGKMGESPSFAEIRNQYMDVCEELELTHSHQVTFLRSALREEAYQFYQDVIKERVTSLGEAFKLLEDTYASIARQEQIKTLLQTLRTKFSNSERSALESLNEVYSDISRLAAQCSIKYRDDQSKADFLKVAVERQVWARGAVEEYLSNPTSFLPNKFQGFHGRLIASLTARAAAGETGEIDSTGTSHLESHTDLMSAFPTHYGSQYGVRAPIRTRPANLRDRLSPSGPTVPPRLPDAEWKLLSPDEKKSRRTCFKCGERGHYIGDAACGKAATSMTDAIKARYHSAGGDQTAASTILFEIAVSVDEQARESIPGSSPVFNNFFDHLVDEYNDSFDPKDSLSSSNALDFGQPSHE